MLALRTIQDRDWIGNILASLNQAQCVATLPRLTIAYKTETDDDLISICDARVKTLTTLTYTNYFWNF